MATHESALIHFPQLCPQPDACIQAARLATIEERQHNSGEQLGRIESKLDRLQWWLLGLAVSAAGSALLALVSVLIRFPHS